MPKTGIEPIFKSYKEFVLPIKLFRLIKNNKYKKQKLKHKKKKIMPRNGIEPLIFRSSVERFNH